ncbi:MAG: tetratricopeptide repeat protein [Planctomycetaceae bacterium]|nr:tetratricopeptide repeat protein [Planctomycetaceae bacterium]
MRVLFSRATNAAVLAAGLMFSANSLPAQEKKEEGGASPVRGSIVEDRAAAKLLEAGDARFEAEEVKKAIEIWQSVVERYPRSKVRYDAHMRLGNYFLQKERAYDRARVQFQSVIGEENRNEEQRAEAMLKMGVCFYEARNFGKSFQVMRDVIEKFPVSPQVNEAYYYIGLGHFQLGHYSRAIESLEKVGTAMSSQDSRVEKVEAGKRLFVKIEDADLSALEPGQAVVVTCESSSGDKEKFSCYPVGRNVRVVLGALPTQLGRPVPDNGILEVKGDDKVKVTYNDQHTADKQFNRPVPREVTVIGNGIVAVTDGAYGETLKGVVLGKPINIQITDADRDRSDAADKIEAVVEVYRLKSDQELEDDQAKRASQKDAAAGATAKTDGEEPEIEKYKLVDRVPLTLVEARVAKSLTSGDAAKLPPVDGESKSSPAPAKEATKEAAPKEAAAAGEPGAKAAGEPGAAPAKSESTSTEAKPDDDSFHSGVFRAVVSVVKADEAVADDDTLQALVGDVIRITYLDELNIGEGVRTVQSEVKCVEGNLGGVRVTRAVISDQELRIQTKLKTASALTNIGNRYKEFGLKSNADAKYEQALTVCEEIMQDAQKLGGNLLEETYVQLWKVYYEMDQLDLAAAMAQRLQREFPNSGFVDDALLQLADVARKQKNHQRAIGIYTRIVSMQTSQLRGEAQFGIAQCYEDMAADLPETQAAQQAQLLDRSFQEYKKVFDSFPQSGRVGEAVAKMANYYYQQKDYARAVDTFETVLSQYPDAKFLDVILFNYGRCLYRMNRKPDARSKFDQLIGEFPESPLAADAKKISDALTKSGF